MNIGLIIPVLALLAGCAAAGERDLGSAEPVQNARAAQDTAEARARESQTGDPSFTVASFNIRFDGIGEERWAWPERREIVVEAIRGLEPDIMGLQEVTSWEGMEAVASRQIPDLSAALPEYLLAGARPADRIWSSNPILVRRERFRVVESGVVFFAPRPLRYPQGWWGDMTARFARWVRLADTTRDGASILVVNAHYSPVRLIHRWRSSGILIRHLEEIRREGEPLIVMGDLNAQPQRPSVRRLRRRLDLADPLLGHTGGTYHRGRPEPARRRIDYVLHSPDLIARDARIPQPRPNARPPSDHDPVMVELHYWW